MAKCIDVLIADQSEEMRKKLREILESTGKIKVIGMAKDGKEAISLFEKLKPHAVILDIKIPVQGGVETAVELYFRAPEIPIIILRDYPELRFRETFLKTKHIVFLDKSKEFEMIPKVLEKLCQGSLKKKKK
ncbi:MAG TPA: response regulator [Nitrospinota bacterium]|nr:response regulator [Nitrospinota bacterium]